MTNQMTTEKNKMIKRSILTDISIIPMPVQRQQMEDLDTHHYYLIINSNYIMSKNIAQWNNTTSPSSPKTGTFTYHRQKKIQPHFTKI